ncbi:hypothetical protein EDC65_2242 [Stella humosa]|uniref:Uncharacterized protein n=1 Tax=Stella humosa TaxID=94 RepID=A0A3N1M9T4_9PROT|nr:hypothetical protein [Stella humosa]ROQ00443.1 hypothetical protein EDC65_2242 [Stella humosa]BBK30313.1 hypothetical protein STHU_09470 [Stella humosa]
MTLPINATNVARFVPSAFSAAARTAAVEAGEADLQRFDAPPTYLVNVPTPLTRPVYQRAIVASGVHWPDDRELMAALRREVAVALDEDDPERARLLDLIDHYSAIGAEAAGAEVTAEVNRIEFAVRQSSRAFAAVVAQRSYFQEMVPLIGAQVFLRGRENPDRIFRRREGLVTDEELATIPPGELAEVCHHIQGLIYLRPAQEKNSDGPSPSRGGPPTSPVAPAPPTAPAGTSSERSSTETPAST